MGMVDFSPELNTQGKRWEVMKLVCKCKHGKRINPRIIKDKAASCSLEKPLSCSLDQAVIRCREKRRKYLEMKPDADEMREAFLLEQSD